MGGHVMHESRLELPQLLLTNIDPHFQQIYAQPFLLVARVSERVCGSGGGLLAGVGPTFVGAASLFLYDRR
jgi:hypothetical protein